MEEKAYAIDRIGHARRFMDEYDNKLAAFILRDVAINSPDIPTRDLLWTLSKDGNVTRGDIEGAIEFVEQDFGITDDDYTKESE